MAIKPSGRIPTWATAGGADIVDPGAPQQADGWDVDDKPPAGWMNWYKNRVGAWIEYLTSVTDLDLKNWTLGAGEDTAGGFLRVAFGADGGPSGVPMWMGIDDTGQCWTSINGQHWQKRGAAAATTGGRSICYDPVIGWVQGGSAESSVSTDFGDTWTSGAGLADDIIHMGSDGAGTLVAIVNRNAGINNTPGGGNLIYSSSDGLAWTLRSTSAAGVQLGRPVFANGTWLVNGHGSGSFSGTASFTSPTGVTWTDRSAQWPTTGFSKAYFPACDYSSGAGKWFAVGIIDNNPGHTVEIWSTTNPNAAAWALAYSFTLSQNINLGNALGDLGAFLEVLPDGRIVAIQESSGEGGEYETTADLIAGGSASIAVSHDNGATWSEFAVSFSRDDGLRDLAFAGDDLLLVRATADGPIHSMRVSA